MLKLKDLKVGKFIIIDDSTFEVLEYSHKKLARGGAIIKTRLKNLESKTVIEKTFKAAEKIEEASLKTVECQYLYETDEEFYFMNSSDFNQIFLKENIIGEKKKFLKEGGNVEIVYSQAKPIGINLPIKMTYKVIDADPGVKGDTASSPTKEARIETGLKVQVPLFIKEGDIIKIDTRNGSYLEREN